MATTYKKLSELIRDTYYASHPSDDAQKSLRYFAELVAILVAECASEDAFSNSNQGEVTFANNQFISTFKDIEILEEADGTIYSVLPATPAGLPNGREIVSVDIEGSKCLSFIPIQAQADFAQQLIGHPYGLNLYEINGTRVVFKPYTPLFDASSNTAKIKMVGAVSGTDLLTSDLTIPKNYEGRIWDKAMARLLPLKQIQQDTINDSVSNPS